MDLLMILLIALAVIVVLGVGFAVLRKMRRTGQVLASGPGGKQ